MTIKAGYVLMFSICDMVAGLFSKQPWCAPTALYARRVFIDAMADKQSEMARHPEDYVLFEIGLYDQKEGVVVPYDAPIRVMTGVEAANIVKNREVDNERT